MILTQTRSMNPKMNPIYHQILPSVVEPPGTNFIKRSPIAIFMAPKRSASAAGATRAPPASRARKASASKAGSNWRRQVADERNFMRSVYQAGRKAALAKRKPVARKAKPSISKLDALLYLSAFGHGRTPPLNVNAVGYALTVSDLKRGTIDLLAGKHLIIYSPSVVGEAQVNIFDSAGTHRPGTTLDLSPTAKYANDYPKSAKPTRGSIAIKAINPSTSRSGSVTVHNTTSPLGLSWIASSYDVSNAADIIDGVMSHPNSKQYTVEQLALLDGCFVTFPATQSGNNLFKEWVAGTAHGPTHMQWGRADVDQSLSTILMVINVPTQQTFELTLCTQMMQRHSEKSNLGQLMEAAPRGGNAVTQSQINSIGEQNGANMVPIRASVSARSHPYIPY
jgi:hypothetical protein